MGCGILDNSISLSTRDCVIQQIFKRRNGCMNDSFDELYFFHCFSLSIFESFTQYIINFPRFMVCRREVVGCIIWFDMVGMLFLLRKVLFTQSVCVTHSASCLIFLLLCIIYIYIYIYI